MKKTSILIEVDDTVYDLVVAPHKKAKTFSKLAATLLQGYIENDYIQSYADGTLETMHKASVSALDDILGDMSSSLANMGLYTNELKNTSEEGVSTFNSSEPSFNSSVPLNSEVDALKEDISQLREQNEDIMSMLKQLVSNGAVVSRSSEPKVNTHGVSPKSTVNRETLDSDDDGLSLSLISTVDEDSKESKVDASKTMSALLMGNQYSF